MSKLKSYEKGAAMTMIIVGLGWLALGLSASKAGEEIYEKQQIDKIAEQVQEQANHLVKQAPKLGKSGDEAVRESMRLNQMVKDMKKEGLRDYSTELLKEGMGLSLGLQLGTAGKLGEAIGHGLNMMAVEENAVKTVKGEIEVSESDLKIWEIIKGSRSNVDDFELARYKAELDEIARMKGEIADISKEMQELIAKQQQAKEYREKLHARHKEKREKAREKALEKEEIKEAFKEKVKAAKKSEKQVPEDKKETPTGVEGINLKTTFEETFSFPCGGSTEEGGDCAETKKEKEGEIQIDPYTLIDFDYSCEVANDAVCSLAGGKCKMHFPDESQYVSTEDDVIGKMYIGDESGTITYECAQCAHGTFYYYVSPTECKVTFETKTFGSCERYCGEVFGELGKIEERSYSGDKVCECYSP